MGSPLELRDFTIRDLEFHWQVPAPGSKGQERDFRVTYQVAVNSTDPLDYRLELVVADSQSPSEKVAGYSLKATIWGFFRFPDGLDREKREYHIRINGITMLYGTLRGALATIGGMLPPNRRYVLPTINVFELIEAAEGKAKAAAPTLPPPSRQT